MNEDRDHGELTLGELFRGIKEIKETLRIMTSGLLTQDLFAAEKRLLVDGIDYAKAEVSRLYAEIATMKEKAEASERAEHLRSQEVELRANEQSARNKQFVWALLASPLIAGVIAIAVNMISLKVV